MSIFSRLCLPCCLTLCLSGCFSVKNNQAPAIPLQNVAAAKASIEQKKQNLKNKSKSAAQMPEILGGVISSDRWVVYKDKEEEEFAGNVRYDGDVYAFRSDYALSQRKLNLFTAKGHVFARRNEPTGTYYEIYADKASYNYKTGQGQAEANKSKRIKLIYKNEKGDFVTALAQRAEFDTENETFLLTGNVQVSHQSAQKQISHLKAQTISVRQKEQYAILQGDAEVKNKDYSVKAQTVEYDGVRQKAYAYGQRPLAQGKTEDGTFAIIADKVSAETDSRKIHVNGKVQGWIVSDKINNSKANENF